MPNIDLAGNTLIVSDIQVGATTPGSTGNSLSSTELSRLDGVTAGTATASKAVVLGASKEIATLGAVTAAAVVATSVSTTGGVTSLSGTAVPATAGAVAAGAPITCFSSGWKLWVTSDAPTHSATKGDLCINTGGSSSSTRLYVNNGTTTWIAITTAT